MPSIFVEIQVSEVLAPVFREVYGADPFTPLVLSLKADNNYKHLVTTQLLEALRYQKIQDNETENNFRRQSLI